MSRTDIHRPKDLDPANYEHVGDGDRGKGHNTEDGWEWDEPPYLYAPVDYEQKAFNGHYVERGGCDHCGAANLRYTEIFLHKPTGEYVTVGTDCATKLHFTDMTAKQISDRRERRRVEAKQTEELKKPDVKRAVDSLLEQKEAGSTNEFVASLLRRWNKYGDLSERQVAAVIRGIEARERNAQLEAENPPAPVPVTDERIEIIGEIVSFKWNEWRERFVMTVRDDRGFKVWGTVPAAFDGTAESGFVADRGARVKFHAKVTVSDKDETFGFFKRPTKATFLED